MSLASAVGRCVITRFDFTAAAVGVVARERRGPDVIIVHSLKALAPGATCLNAFLYTTQKSRFLPSQNT
jgi:hypothetical protein